MNIPRLVAAVVVAYLVILGTDILIHGFWLRPDYEATKSIWRPEAEMNSLMYGMYIAQAIAAVTFVLIWALGFAGGGIGKGVLFGLLMGLFQQIWAIVNWVIIPMPCELATKWFVSGLAQAILIGIATALIYRPRAATT